MSLKVIIYEVFNEFSWFKFKGKNYKLDKDLILNAYNLGWKYINLNYSPENFKKAIDYKKWINWRYKWNNENS